MWWRSEMSSYIHIHSGLLTTKQLPKWLLSSKTSYKGFGGTTTSKVRWLREFINFCPLTWIKACWIRLSSETLQNRHVLTRKCQLYYFCVNKQVSVLISHHYLAQLGGSCTEKGHFASWIPDKNSESARVPAECGDCMTSVLPGHTDSLRTTPPLQLQLPHHHQTLTGEENNTLNTTGNTHDMWEKRGRGGRWHQMTRV